MHKNNTGPLDAQSLKKIEQFSQAVCQRLEADDSKRFTRAEVIYGLTAFIAAILAAINEQSRPQ